MTDKATSKTKTKNCWFYLFLFSYRLDNYADFNFIFISTPDSRILKIFS